MKFKIYGKKYESYYKNYGRRAMIPSNETINRDYFFVQLSNYKNEDYYKLLRREMLYFQKQLWDFSIKYYWLMRKFRLRRADGSVVKTPNNRDSHGFYVMLFHKFNFSHMFFRKGVSKSIARIAWFIFPHFDIDNPIDNPKRYSYPFKFISLDYLHFVKYLDAAMAIPLLYYADKHRVPFGEFCDMVYNQCLCYNDEHNDEKYVFVRGPVPYFFPACLVRKDVSTKEIVPMPREKLADIFIENLNRSGKIVKREMSLPSFVIQRLRSIAFRKEINEEVDYEEESVGWEPENEESWWKSSKNKIY